VGETTGFCLKYTLVILCLNNAKLVELEWVWGLLQPGFVRWAPPALQNHFNH